MGTTNQITDLLNRESLTVNELAKRLGISRNSVHLQINRLEAAGTVLKMPQRSPTGAGKPAHQYRTAPRKEDVHSEAYRPVLTMLIQTISTDLSRQARVKLFEKTGRSLAKASGLGAQGDLKADIQKSIDVVNALGAMAEVSANNEGHVISCYSCPVATLVHNEPDTCKLVAAFFAEATGKNVTVTCRKKETVVCGFTIN
ncbi:MAG: helix-turn-helix transcriptional regulator [Granulosicoccus sp.]